MRRLALLVAGAGLVAACTGQPYEPSYGVALEQLYPDGVPEVQRRLLADGLLTEQELEQATQASNTCVAVVPGLTLVEPFRWVEQEGDFDGGTIEFEDGVDRDEVIQGTRDCYIEYVGLIEFAWLDQFYFGEWVEEGPTG